MNDPLRRTSHGRTRLKFKIIVPYSASWNMLNIHNQSLPIKTIRESRKSLFYIFKVNEITKVLDI